MREILLLLMLPVTLISFLYGQEKEVTIQLVHKEKPISYEKKDNYLNVLSKIEKNGEIITISSLYDNQGKLIMKILPENETTSIIFSCVSEFYKSLIIVQEGIKEQGDIISAYSISTKEKIWELKAVSRGYELSRDDKFLLLARNFSENKFGIINIQDGNLMRSNIDFGNYFSTFIDNEHIVFLKREVRKNESYNIQEIDPFEKKYWERQRGLTTKKLNLSYKYKSNKISENEYKSTLYEIDKELDKIFVDYKKHKEVKKTKRQSRFTLNTARIIIYNFVEDNIIKDKYIYGKNGAKLITPDSHWGGGIIRVDQLKNIYLQCVYRNTITELSKICKININLNVEWIREFDKGFGMKNCYINDNLFYYFSDNKNQMEYLDCKSGNISKSNKYSSQIQNLNENNLDNVKLNLHTSKIRLNKKNNCIELEVVK